MPLLSLLTTLALVGAVLLVVHAAYRGGTSLPTRDADTNKVFWFIGLGSLDPVAVVAYVATVFFGVGRGTRWIGPMVMAAVSLSLVARLLPTGTALPDRLVFDPDRPEAVDPVGFHATTRFSRTGHSSSFTRPGKPYMVSRIVLTSGRDPVAQRALAKIGERLAGMPGLDEVAYVAAPGPVGTPEGTDPGRVPDLVGLLEVDYDVSLELLAARYASGTVRFRLAETPWAKTVVANRRHAPRPELDLRLSFRELAIGPAYGSARLAQLDERVAEAVGTFVDDIERHLSSRGTLPTGLVEGVIGSWRDPVEPGWLDGIEHAPLVRGVGPLHDGRSTLQLRTGGNASVLEDLRARLEAAGFKIDVRSGSSDPLALRATRTDDDHRTLVFLNPRARAERFVNWVDPAAIAEAVQLKDGEVRAVAPPKPAAAPVPEDYVLDAWNEFARPRTAALARRLIRTAEAPRLLESMTFSVDPSERDAVRIAVARQSQHAEALRLMAKAMHDPETPAASRAALRIAAQVARLDPDGDGADLLKQVAKTREELGLGDSEGGDGEGPAPDPAADLELLGIEPLDGTWRTWRHATAARTGIALGADDRLVVLRLHVDPAHDRLHARAVWAGGQGGTSGPLETGSTASLDAEGGSFEVRRETGAAVAVRWRPL